MPVFGRHDLQWARHSLSNGRLVSLHFTNPRPRAFCHLCSRSLLCVAQHLHCAVHWRDLQPVRSELPRVPNLRLLSGESCFVHLRLLPCNLSATASHMISFSGVVDVQQSRHVRHGERQRAVHLQVRIFSPRRVVWYLNDLFSRCLAPTGRSRRAARAWRTPTALPAPVSHTPLCKSVVRV